MKNTSVCDAGGFVSVSMVNRRRRLFTEATVVPGSTHYKLTVHDVQEKPSIRRGAHETGMARTK